MLTGRYPIRLGMAHGVHVLDAISMNFDVFLTLLTLAGGRIPDDQIIEGKHIWLVLAEDATHRMTISIFLTMKESPPSEPNDGGLSCIQGRELAVVVSVRAPWLQALLPPGPTI